MKIMFSGVLLIVSWFCLSAENSEVPEEHKKPDEKFIEITEKVSVIELKSTDTVVYRTVNITPTEIVVLEFPEGVLLDGDPSGSVAVGHDAILKTDIIPSPLVVKVTAMLNETDLNSNLQIKLNCGITVIFNFRITLPDVASNRIIFTYPEFAEKNKREKDVFLELKLKLQKDHEKGESGSQQPPCCGKCERFFGILYV